MNNIYSTIAKNYIVNNKKKNLILISTITIVSIFLTSLIILSFSLKEMNKKYQGKHGSYYYGALINLNKSQENKVKNHLLTKEYLKTTYKYKNVIYIVTENRKNAVNQLNEICSDIGIDKSNLKINEKEINKSMYEELKDYSPYIFMGLLIILLGFFIIYTMYFLTFKNRIKHYGILKTIGFTKRQLRKCVYFEILMLSSISIPLGIFLGRLFITFLITYFPSKSGIEIIFRFWMLPLVFILVLFTVIFSAYSPIKKVLKISPIESNNFSFTDKCKHFSYINKMKLEKALALTNISRNKRLTLITEISLILSSIIFITGGTILKSMDVKSQVKKYFISSDIKISLKNEGNALKNGYINKDLVTKIINISGVKNLREYTYNTGFEVGTDRYLPLYGLNENAITSLKKYVIYGDINYNNLLKESGAIYYCHRDKLNNSKYKLGDIINIKLKKTNGLEITQKVKIDAIVTDTNINKKAGHNDEIYLPDKNILVKHSENFVVLQMDCPFNNSSSVKNKILNMQNVNFNLEVNTFDDYVEMQSKEKKGILLISYTICALLALIAVINYINLISTSIAERKGEFVLLFALGLTKRQIKKTITIEYLILSLITFIVSSVLGNFLGYKFVSMFSKSATYAIYSFPLKINIIFTIVIFMIPIITIYIINRNFLRTSLAAEIKYKE